MQIRLANKQDEPAIALLINELMQEHALTPDPSGTESDLKNIESYYFGHDGLFLVAEEDREIMGIAGARAGADDQLELVRLAVAKKFRKQGIAKKLLETIFSFASDMNYKRILVEPARQYPGGDEALRAWGFTSDPSEDAQKVWYFDMKTQHPPDQLV